MRKRVIERAPAPPGGPQGGAAGCCSSSSFPYRRARIINKVYGKVAGDGRLRNGTSINKQASEEKRNFYTNTSRNVLLSPVLALNEAQSYLRALIKRIFRSCLCCSFIRRRRLPTPRCSMSAGRARHLNKTIILSSNDSVKPTSARVDRAQKEKKKGKINKEPC